MHTLNNVFSSFRIFCIQFPLRTFRLSVVEGTDYASVSVGNLISGPLFVAIGYFGVFGVSSVCNIIALLYLVLWVQESVPDKNEETKEEVMERQSSTSSSMGVVTTSLLYTLEGLRTVIKPRQQCFHYHYISCTVRYKIIVKLRERSLKGFERSL